MILLRVKHLIASICLVVFFSSPTAFASEPQSSPEKDEIRFLKIGVRALKGVDESIKSWVETVKFLNQEIKGYQFILVPLVGFNDMRNAVKNQKIDFVLTNPYAYSEFNKKYGVTRILTLNKKQPNGIASSTFAAAIFTRSDRNDINGFDDINSKSIMGVNKEAFGGWLMAVRELLHNDIDPYTDASEVLFAQDNTHQTVVYSVLKGEVDIGVVRTGIIEQLIQKGKIRKNDLKVLRGTHIENDLAMHSTQHYPEWPFSVMPHVPTDLSNQVFNALLKIKADSNAAKTGHYTNWVAPLDYSEVYKLKDEIELRYLTIAKIWNKHWITLLLFLILVTSITIYTIYLHKLNIKLKQSELDLSRHRDHLEETVRKRTEELYIAKQYADNANIAKSDFISQMSHEIRTPLNAILGFGQLLEMEKTDNTEIHEHTKEITTAGKYLLSLINEILDLAKIESGNNELHIEKVSCNKILRESLALVTSLAHERNISIDSKANIECVVNADPKRLQQIFVNLLNNAIKYNKPDGNISVSLEKTADNHCMFRIKDTGVGIKPEFQSKVFQSFAREDEHADKVEGTGLGLNITRELVIQMGGQIDFSSEYNVGTEFWITLPQA